MHMRRSTSLNCINLRFLPSARLSKKSSMKCGSGSSCAPFAAWSSISLKRVDSVAGVSVVPREILCAATKEANLRERNLAEEESVKESQEAYEAPKALFNCMHQGASGEDTSLRIAALTPVGGRRYILHCCASGCPQLRAHERQ